MMENVPNRQNIRLIADSQKALKAVLKDTFRQCEIINNDLLLVRGARQKITLNKPIADGFTILELSKLIMHTFYYDHLKSKYADRCRILFTNTDSLCCIMTSCLPSSLLLLQLSSLLRAEVSPDITVFIMQPFHQQTPQSHSRGLYNVVACDLCVSDYIEFCLSEIAVDEEEPEPELIIYYVCKVAH